MSEERKMILQMLKEGKITADEAVKLLEALGEKAPASHEMAAPRVRHRPRPQRPSRPSLDFDEVGFDSLRREIQSAVAEAVRAAKVASKEAIEEAKESVREAMKESRKTLREAAREVHRIKNVHKHREFDLEDEEELEGRLEEIETEIEEELDEELEALQEQFEAAEEKFEEAKELMSEAKEMKERAKELFQQAEEEDDEEHRQDLLEEARELEREADSLMPKAQSLAREAEMAMLKARREAKERGLKISSQVTRKVNSALGKIGHSNTNAASIGKVIGQVTSQIGPIIASTFKNMRFGDSNTFELKNEMTLKFEDLNQPAKVNVSLQNGHIEIGTHDDSDAVRIVLHKKIRGVTSEERAKEIANNLVEMGVTDNLLSIEGQRKFGGRHVVNVSISLPARGKYELNLSTINGKITCENVNSTDITAVSTNGKIIVRGGSADSVRAATTNGKVIADVMCNDINLNTTNGNIVCTLRDAAKGKSNLGTVNGNVRLYLEPQVKFELEAKTHMGKIKAELSDAEIIDEVKKFGISRLKARSSNIEGEECVRIKATTTHGGIKVLPVQD